MQHRNLLKNQNAKQKLQIITREHPSCKINIQKYMCVFQIASEHPSSLTLQPRILMRILHKCFPLIDQESPLVWNIQFLKSYQIKSIFKLDFSFCLVSGKTVWLSSEREIPAESQITQFPLFHSGNITILRVLCVFVFFFVEYFLYVFWFHWDFVS